MYSDTDEVELSVMRLMAFTRNILLYHKWPHHRKLIGKFYPSTLDSVSSEKGHADEANCFNISVKDKLKI
jgi:hypothetical protein